jgi:anti-sigma-K factor RskA
MNPIEPKRSDASGDRLERALCAALRPVDPGAAFTAALQARLVTADLRPQVAVLRPPTVSRHRRLYLASLAVAAAIVVALGIAAQIAELRGEERAALARAEQARAHAQLLLALEITSERLGLAQQRIEQFQAQERNP